MDGVRDFLLNFGSGLWLVLAVDYHVLARYRAWAGEMAKKAQKMGTEPAFLVL